MWSYLSTVHSGRMTPFERAICAALGMMVAFGAVAFIPTVTQGTGVADSFRPVDASLAMASALVSGLASGLGLIARLLVGLLVAAPLDQGADLVAGWPEALVSRKFVIGTAAAIAFTLVLPYADFPQRMWDWTRATTGIGGILRSVLFYAGYVLWTIVLALGIFFIIDIFSEFVGIAITGRDGSESFDVPERIIIGVLTATLAGVGFMLYALWKRGWPVTMKHVLRSIVVSALIAGFFTVFMLGNVIWGASLRPESASVPAFAPFAQMIDAYLKNRGDFVLQSMLGGLGGAVFLMPFVALCWHFWDDARSKGRHSYAVSVVILALLLLICGTVGAMAAELISYLWGGLQAIGSMTWLGRAVGVGVALLLAWRIIIVPWPREVPVTEFPEKQRPRSILPPHVAEAVRQARTE